MNAALIASETATHVVGFPILTFVILKLVGAMVPLRVRQEDEVTGLDVSQHGESLHV